MRVGFRVLVAFGVVVAGTLLQVASAAGQESDVITFTGPLFVAPAPPGEPPLGVVVSDTCQHTTDEGESVPCLVLAVGELEPVGTADAFAVSSEGVFVLEESFVFDPSTGTGTGSGTGTKVDLDNGEISPVTFTATFGVLPTDDPDVFLDSGVVNVQES